MSYFGNRIELKDTPQLDAFGRLRVSEASTLFDSQQEYGLDTLRTWDAAANGVYATGAVNGSVTDASCSVGPRNVNSRMVPLVISTVSGQYVVMQSRQYVRYVPGKSHLILMTGIFSPGTVANTDARTGYFDAYNGVFLKVTNGVASFTIRTSTSGSVSDSNTVTQASWNIDTFDGTGPSGLTLDLTKTQILFIQAQWLGVGRVTCGFDIDGILYPAHEFLNANNLVVPYTQSFNLPVRMELRNTGTSVGATTYFCCCSVQSEGGESIRGFPYTANNGITRDGVTTREPVLSIRPKATFNSITNRGHIELAEYFLNATTNNALYEIVIGGTLTGASWTSVSTYSITEYDVSATAITGGESVISGYVNQGSGASAGLISAGVIDVRNPLVLQQIDALTATQIPISIVCTSETGTSNILAGINWHERVI